MSIDAAVCAPQALQAVWLQLSLCGSSRCQCLWMTRRQDLHRRLMIAQRPRPTVLSPASRVAAASGPRRHALRLVVLTSELRYGTRRSQSAGPAPHSPVARRSRRQVFGLANLISHVTVQNKLLFNFLKRFRWKWCCEAAATSARAGRARGTHIELNSDRTDRRADACQSRPGAIHVGEESVSRDTTKIPQSFTASERSPE